jgi:hypothetical protein
VHCVADLVGMVCLVTKNVNILIYVVFGGGSKKIPEKTDRLKHE